MKLELITMHAIKNYGSALQTYASQELLKKHGFDVTIINYVRKDVRDEILVKTWAGYNIIKRLVILPTFIRWKKIFGSFYSHNFKLTDKVYTYAEDFENYPLNSDIYCTGSDQVWNSVWNKGIEFPLYLNFVSNDKYKFALAASFGQNYLSEIEVDDTKQFINQYRFISVREESGVDILKNQYHYNKVNHILDPTLCLDAKEWRKIAPANKIKGKYILIYNLNRSKEFDEYAKKLSKITKLKLVRFCTRYDQFLRIGKSVLVPDILDFISLIDNATYVLTDSFHATVFSMNLNTEPICIYPSEFGGRISSFLSMVQSPQRHVTSYDDFDVINRDVDFELVNSILNAERDKVDKYIMMIKNDAEEFYNSSFKENHGGKK
jgi:hypothetical protein